jgi:hypothetical protein
MTAAGGSAAMVMPAAHAMHEQGGALPTATAWTVAALTAAGLVAAVWVTAQFAVIRLA